MTEKKQEQAKPDPQTQAIELEETDLDQAQGGIRDGTSNVTGVTKSIRDGTSN